MSHIANQLLHNAKQSLDELHGKLEQELATRIEYQDLVYKICYLVDRFGAVRRDKATLDTLLQRIEDIFAARTDDTERAVAKAKESWAEDEAAWARRCNILEKEIETLKAAGQKDISNEWFEGHATLVEENGNLKADNERLQADIARLTLANTSLTRRVADFELDDKANPHRGRDNLHHIHNLYSEFICTDWPSIEQMTSHLRSYINGTRASDRILREQIHELANQLLTRSAIDTRRIGNDLLKSIGQVGIRKSNILIEKDKLLDENIELRRAVRDVITRMDSFFLTRKQVKSMLKLLLGDLKQVPACVGNDLYVAVQLFRSFLTQLRPGHLDAHHQLTLHDDVVMQIEALLDRNPIEQ